MTTTGTNISIDSLRYIVNFVETHGYCSQAELFGAGCTDCIYYVSDHMLKCYGRDGIPELVR